MSAPPAPEPDGPKTPAGAGLDEALAHVEGKVAREEGPNRYDARWLLLELGGHVEAAGEEAAAPRVRRAREAVAPWEEAWEKAVQEELQLATAEHVHAVDPRYLTHPRYDLAYTLAARARLERRLLAARLLGCSLSAALQRALERADTTLEAHQSASGADHSPGEEKDYGHSGSK